MTYSFRMVGVKLAFLGFVAAVGCTKTNPAAFCADGTCIDPHFPYCDVDGAAGGEPGTCIAVTCTPGEIKACHIDAALTCTATGNGYEEVACEVGCSDSPAPHCKYLEPKFLPGVCDSPAQLDNFTITTSGTLDPNLDSNCTGGVVIQAGGPSICVLRYNSISVAAGAVLTISGAQKSTSNAIAFVADQSVSIVGTLDVGAHSGFNGPGGGFSYSGGFSSGIGNAAQAGGGAGGATIGGAGGSGTSDGGAANGGAPAVNPGSLTALVGGASSARHLDGSSDDLSLGGGGGAVTLISCHANVSVAGTLSSGGGGGTPGGVFMTATSAGQGGGAGGNVVLQGLRVEITGRVFANGGGGGGGAISGSTSSPGQDGSQSDSVQAYGGSAVNGSGAGGTGGIGVRDPTGGTHPTATNASAGGGGGSVGFLQTYTPNGVIPTLTPAQISPPFQPNGVVQLR